VSASWKRVYGDPGLSGEFLLGGQWMPLGELSIQYKSYDFSRTQTAMTTSFKVSLHVQYIRNMDICPYFLILVDEADPT